MAAVLVVDDVENQAQSLALALRLEGLDASAAVGPEAALAMLRVSPARVVVCDLRMRGKNGLELARELEAIYPGMKIGQLSFVQLSEPAERPYGSEGIGSKYQGQQGPTPSRYWKNFSRDGER